MAKPSPAPPPAAPSAAAVGPARRRRLPEILPRCTGCGRCVAACPPRVIWLEARGWDKTAVLHDPQGCTGCSDCAVVCPFGAIRMRAAPHGPPDRLA